MYRLQDVLKDVQSNDRISLACFIEFGDCTQDKFKEIMERIMKAFNLMDPNAQIDFDLYVRIKCFLEGQTLEFEEKLDLWMRILNPGASSTLAKTELRELFEKFARGRMQEEPIQVSQVFADNMISLFANEGMEDPGAPEFIIVSLIKEKILDGTFDIDLLNQMILPDCEYKVYSKNFWEVCG